MAPPPSPNYNNNNDYNNKSNNDNDSSPGMIIYQDDLLPSDVIMGRGALPAEYVGNKRLRALIAAYRPAYDQAGKYKEKQAICQAIMQHVASVRFVKRTTTGDDGQWTIVRDTRVILEKIKQLLRDLRPDTQAKRRHRKRKRNNSNASGSSCANTSHASTSTSSTSTSVASTMGEEATTTQRQKQHRPQQGLQEEAPNSWTDCHRDSVEAASTLLLLHSPPLHTAVNNNNINNNVVTPPRIVAPWPHKHNFQRSSK